MEESYTSYVPVNGALPASFQPAQNWGDSVTVRGRYQRCARPV
jgi:hypothetical protein